MDYENIKNIFLSYPSNDPLTDYVKCINLSVIPRTIPIWRIHEDRYVDLASRLSVCVYQKNKLRECSTPLANIYHVSLRRLEEYAEHVGIIDVEDSIWKGYGKLIEITIYMKYDSDRRASWSRHFEIRMYISVPLNITEYSKTFDKKLLDYMGRRILEWIGFDTELVNLVELEDEEKIGFREVYNTFIREDLGYIPIDYIPTKSSMLYTPVGRVWCNGVFRCSYDSAYFVIHEYVKGHTYRAERFFSLAEVREILSPLYERVFEVLKYW